MASQVAWLAFDAEQQRRTNLMIAALANQGTVDELGLGVVRDLIAEALHPGLTVLHTRAKYLIFIPRDFCTLRGTSSAAVAESAAAAEKRLIKELVAYYSDNGGLVARGIIGRRTAEDGPQQPPSHAYWALLRRLGIRATKGSVNDYCRELAEANTAGHARSLLRSDDDEQLEHAPELWAELPSSKPALGGFHLNGCEAEWLREKFLRAEQAREPDARSLVAWLLAPERTTWVRGVARAWDHPSHRDFPHATAHAMRLGHDLDVLVHGARILYNYLCAQAMPPGAERDVRVERYEKAMVDPVTGWAAEFAAHELKRSILAELDVWVAEQMRAGSAAQLARARWRSTHTFLSRWYDLAASGKALLADRAAIALIAERESAVKPGRARLKNHDLLRNWPGDSGYSRFDYNWRVASRILYDIHAGLGTRIVDAARTT